MVMRKREMEALYKKAVKAERNCNELCEEFLYRAEKANSARERADLRKEAALCAKASDRLVERISQLKRILDTWEAGKHNQ